MKKLLIPICLILFILPSYAMDWSKVRTCIIAWTDSNIPDSDIQFVWDIFTADFKADPSHNNAFPIGRSDTKQFEIHGLDSGWYLVGVRTVSQIQDEMTNWVDFEFSDISWSDDPIYVQDGVTFGIRVLPTPQRPKDLKEQ